MPTSDLKIAAAYIRVSTDDQEEYSPDSQVRLIREYARKNGYLLPEAYVFQDDGISAATTPVIYSCISRRTTLLLLWQ